uniref:Uncharacterized protein n=1 Tax=Megaselia scalaris TaxID=36166 RepID=T1GU50_MEGSC
MRIPTFINSFSGHEYIAFETAFSQTCKPPFRNPRKADWKKFKTIATARINQQQRDQPYGYSLLDTGNLNRMGIPEF